MDPSETPTLEHGVPAPETYLPATPEWVWYAVGAGVLVLLGVLFYLWKKFFYKPKPKNFEHDYFHPALASLRELEPLVEETPLAQIAARASLAIRAYLAGSRAEPALYQTVEEFKATHGMLGKLPATTESLLNDLNAAKYDRSSIDSARATDFLARSRACLDSLHASRSADADKLTAANRKEGEVVR